MGASTANAVDTFPGRPGSSVGCEAPVHGGTATSVQVSGGTLSRPLPTFSQAFTWNDLGLAADLTYPACTGTLACTSTAKRKVYYGYTNGLLTSVGPYYATAIAYHPNGMTSAVTHGAGCGCVPGPSLPDEDECLDG